MVVEKLATLPHVIFHQGITFTLRIWAEGDRDIRLCYMIEEVIAHSENYGMVEGLYSWYNPFADNTHSTTFLYLKEGIETDQELCDAIDECREWLVENGLIEK